MAIVHHPPRRAWLEALYARYAGRSFVHPDPLEFLYRYPDPLDREIAGLLAAGLAYGRVASILRSVEPILAALGPRPARFLCETDIRQWRKMFMAFRHRWTTGEDVARLLRAAAALQRSEGSLGAALCVRLQPGDADILPALRNWYEALNRSGDLDGNSLVSDPRRGSASKRLHLYLRWMVRQDEVDPGGWTGMAPALLVIPLDVHMHRIGRALGFTQRRAADEKTALEVTAGFRALCPEDPVRYDFALTRLPLREGWSADEVEEAVRRAGRTARTR